MLSASALRHRVTLMQPSEARGATFRDPQQTFADVAEVFAQVEPLAGREALRHREQGGEADARIRLRWRADVTEKWRVRQGSTVYEIIAPPVNVRERDLTELLCREYRG